MHSKNRGGPLLLFPKLLEQFTVKYGVIVSDYFSRRAPFEKIGLLNV